MSPTAKKKSAPSKPDGFTAEERAAMKERVKEIKRPRRSPAADAAAGEQEVLAKIAEMADGDRELAARIHEIVMATAAELTPRTYYGMPAYAKDDKVVLFFKNAGKFKTRYATLGFTDKARLDDGAMWPTEFAVAELNAATEAKIAKLVKQAVR